MVSLFTPEDWHCLDGTLYIDQKVNHGWYFARNGFRLENGQMCAVPMKDDLSAPDRSPQFYSVHPKHHGNRMFP